MVSAERINSIESESGVIATLIYHPDFIFYSEDLLPNYFTDVQNQCVYTAIQMLTNQGIFTIDPYNITTVLDSSESTKRMAELLTIDGLNDLMEISENIARHSVEEYRLLANNVIDASFRRDTIDSLTKCLDLCTKTEVKDIEQKIYEEIDDVMLGYSSSRDVPQFKDVIDDCWDEIKARQANGYAGIPFKFKTLNEYATIERGELFIFAGEAKRGKSIMLLNCAADLLKRDLSVLYLDSELNTRLFTARMLSHLTGIEYKRLTSGNYSGEEEGRIDEARAWMKTRKFTHIYMPMFDLQSIYTTIKKVHHTQEIDVLIVDYFKGSGEGDAFDSYQELGRFVDTIKNKVCGDMGIAGIGAAQATVNGKVADSAKIGRNASTIALLLDKSPEEIAEDGEECGNKKLKIVLNRNGMQHADGEFIDLSFDGNRILYEEAQQSVPRLLY